MKSYIFVNHPFFSFFCLCSYCFFELRFSRSKLLKNESLFLWVSVYCSDRRILTGRDGDGHRCILRSMHGGESIHEDQHGVVQKAPRHLQTQPQTQHVQQVHQLVT